ncbi:MAG: hypothetical protein GY835_16110 [bacterium]|nr:hypothetical protein [bacterium]
MIIKTIITVLVGALIILPSCGNDTNPNSPSATGTVHIDPVPAVLDQPWTLTMPDRGEIVGTGDSTLTSLSPGDYTIAWGEVVDWSTPVAATLTLAAEDATTFTGHYLDQTVLATLNFGAGGVEWSAALCAGVEFRLQCTAGDYAWFYDVQQTTSGPPPGCSYQAVSGSCLSSSCCDRRFEISADYGRGWQTLGSVNRPAERTSFKTVSPSTIATLPTSFCLAWDGVGVTAGWTTDVAEDSEFRLSGQSDSTEWIVAHWSIGATYCAVDLSDHVMPGRVLTYRLYAYEEGSGWMILSTETVEIPADD